jgi:hypothetical protein
MDYRADIQWIKEANRAAKPRWDRMDWIERYMQVKGCSPAEAREAYETARWMNKLEESITC